MRLHFSPEEHENELAEMAFPLPSTVDELYVIQRMLEKEKDLVVGVHTRAQALPRATELLGTYGSRISGKRLWFNTREAVGVQPPDDTKWDSIILKYRTEAIDDVETLEKLYSTQKASTPNLSCFHRINWALGTERLQVAKQKIHFCSDETSIQVPSRNGDSHTDTIRVSGSVDNVLNAIYEYFKGHKWSRNFEMCGMARVDEPQKNMCRLIFATLISRAQPGRCENAAMKINWLQGQRSTQGNPKRDVPIPDDAWDPSYRQEVM